VQRCRKIASASPQIEVETVWVVVYRLQGCRSALGTTGEPSIERFRREEIAALASLMGRPPFRQVREVVRRVQADGSVDFDTNHYSVP
jgi:hypothetical protein